MWIRKSRIKRIIDGEIEMLGVFLKALDRRKKENNGKGSEECESMIRAEINALLRIKEKVGRITF